MQLYIHRNNENYGPYSREEVLEFVKQGTFEAGDQACYAGMSDWKPLSELLGISATAEPPKAARPAAAASAAAMPPAASGAMRASGTRAPQTRVRRPAGPAAAPEKKRGAMILLNLVLIGIVAAGIYLKMGGGGPEGQRLMASVMKLLGREPEVNVVVLATPAPVLPAPVIVKPPVVAAAATPAPVATPPPPPKPFDPVDLAASPAAWPKLVRLSQAVDFPAVLNGQVVGSVHVPAGAAVKLVSIQGEQLVLDYHGGRQTLPWKMTDIEAEAERGGWRPPPATTPTGTTATNAP